MIKETNNFKKSLVLTLLLAILTMANAFASQFVLVIDAGHGGHDAGARGSFSNEKDINLNAALAFGRYVEKNCPDVKVIYTRKTDVFIPLHKRADIANKNHANVFVSIHTNALPGGRVARGLETYTMGMRRSNEKLSAAQRENAVITYENDYKQRYEGYDPNSPESAIMFEFIHDKNMAKSVELAKLVQKNVCATANRPDKGVKQDVFLVLRETSMPACLIELGFITTPDEERLLNDETAIDNIAKGIYNAFAKYKNDNYSGYTVPYEAATPEKVRIPTIIPQSDDASVDAKASNRTSQNRIQTRTVQNDNEPKAQIVEETGNSSVQNVAKQVASNSVSASAKSNAVVTDRLVFKVQILASNVPLSRNNSKLKGQANVGKYVEGGMYKYTVGESENYTEINKLRASLNEKFPGCFVVAFKNGEKMNINEAIRQFRKQKNK